MANDKFRQNFAKIISRSKMKLEEATKRATLEISRSLIARSPVDTGRFKNNWMHGVGAVNTSLTTGTDDAALGRIQTGLGGWNPKLAVFYITNSLPYARRLEYGWSQQAPQGMVRLTVANFKEHVRKAAESMR